MSEKGQFDEIVCEFLSETRENIDGVERDLVVWEKQPTAKREIDQIFRAFHTLKGTASLLGFERLVGLAHQVENVLCSVREGSLALNTATVTVLLKVLDTIRLLLRYIEETGEEEDGDYEVLVAELNLKTLQKQVIAHPEAEIPKKIEEPPVNPTPESTESTIHVKVALLDRLMKLTGELIEGCDEISQMSVVRTDAFLGKASARLRQLISELQKCVIKTRRQPIGNIWSNFPRLVRDAGMSSGKKIRLDTSGYQMEIDKNIIEAIRDPLTHLVRNCIDHGIETPEKRLAAGKPEEGCITLRAFEQNGHVIVDVEDDGAGISVELVRETAVRRSLITHEQSLAMSESELHRLIFLAGFTTAPEVTKLSGRGVGMNVVKTNLDGIHGTVDINSRPGAGTLFRIKIPPVMAAIPSEI